MKKVELLAPAGNLEKAKVALMYGADVAGWASMMALILCSSGLIMLMLGMLGEYIWRALDASRNRPPFIVDETKGFDK